MYTFGKKFDVLFWPITWLISLVKIQGNVFREGLYLFPVVLWRQCGSIVVILVTGAIFLAAAAPIGIESRLVAIVAVWTLGMAVWTENYLRPIGPLETTITVVQALLFGVFWGTVLSFL